MKKTTQSVTAVVPTLGRSRYLGAALRALRSDGGDALEIVVVAPCTASLVMDPADGIGLGDLRLGEHRLGEHSLEELGLRAGELEEGGLVDRVLRTDRPLGFAAANNLALAATHRPIVALVNDDAVIEPGWFQALLDALAEDPQLAAVQGLNLRLHKGDAGTHLDGWGIGWNSWLQAVQLGHGRPLSDAPMEPVDIFGVSATAALYRRAALASVCRGGSTRRGFDERLGSYYEDVELAGRLRRAGYRARSIPEARARHAGSLSGRELPLGGAALIHGNRLLVVSELLGRALPWQLPRLVAREALDGLGAVLRGRPRQALGVVAGLARAVRGAPGRLHAGAPVPLDPTPEPARAAKRTSLSAVVVHWRNEAELAKLLAAWPADPCESEDLELIVVDNSASVDPRCVLPHSRCIRLETPAHNLGFGGGVARGVAAARGEWILVLNPDIVPQPGAIDALRDAIARYPQADGFAPTLVDPEGGTQHRWQLQPLPSPARLVLQGLWGGSARGPRRPPLDGTPVQQPAAAALLLRRSTLDAVGGFDDGYFPAWFEDVDLGRRLVSAGATLRYIPSARFEHARGASVPALGYGRFLWIYDRHAARYLARHHGRAWAGAARGVRSLGLALRLAALAIAKPRRARTRTEAARGLSAALLGTLSGWRWPRSWHAQYTPARASTTSTPSGAPEAPHS